VPPRMGVNGIHPLVQATERNLRTYAQNDSPDVDRWCAPRLRAVSVFKVTKVEIKVTMGRLLGLVPQRLNS
jgi:hypothetical protein